jgi:hypothetical protein
MERTKRVARIIVMLSAATLILLQSVKIRELRTSRDFWISQQKYEKFWVDSSMEQHKVIMDCLDREMKRK